MSFTIALPTGRSMEMQTLEVFKEAGIAVERPHPRSLRGIIRGLDGLEKAIFCRPAEIPRLITQGVADIGVTGRDIVFSSNYQYRVGILDTKLEFSRSSLQKTECVIIAKDDDPIQDIQALLDDAQGTCIATEYPEATKAFLDTKLGRTASFEYQEWSGSVETAIVAGMARFGVTLVETGSTLRANGLRVLNNSRIFTSSPVVIVRKGWAKANFNDEVGKVCRPLAALLSGVTKARVSVMLVMNVPQSALPRLLTIVPSSESPTIQRLANENYVSCSVVVLRAEANNVIATAMELGAKDFVKLDVPVIV